eukprot:3304682-Pyramimonas_sp.AAC.1
MPGPWSAWGKHRQVEFRAWERAHHRRFLAHQAGKGVLELVFAQIMKAEGYFLGKGALEGPGPGDQFLGLARSSYQQTVPGAQDTCNSRFCVTCWGP